MWTFIYLDKKNNKCCFTPTATELVVQLRWDVERVYSGALDYGGLTAVVTNFTIDNSTEAAQASLAHLAEMVSSKNPDLLEPVEIRDILPKYILFTKTDQSNIIPQLSCKNEFHELTFSLFWLQL